MKTSPSPLSRDLTAGFVVFIVAIPLCLGIALASGAPLFSGILAGTIGGIIVGAASRSPISVSGPAAALATMVASQIALLGSFQAFQLAVLMAGILQVGFGLCRAGSIAAFFPSSVIKGLLAAIGLLLVLKQIPHLLGHDADPTGEMAFLQPDDANTFSELIRMFGHIHLGTTVIGATSLLVLIVWDRVAWLRTSRLPVALLVVVLGGALGAVFQRLGGIWMVEAGNFVQVPLSDGPIGFLRFLQGPDFSQWTNPAVLRSAVTIAIAASIATLLNLESVDNLDPLQRTSPPNRELVAQGLGNIASGCVGGLPMTSEIIRGSVNINAGGRTKLATITHGVLLLVSVVFFPAWLNRIPLSCLAAIMLVTGARLFNPALVREMWSKGRYQFTPFALTLAAIVFTDLLVGVLLGLMVSLAFILNSNLRRPIRRIMEKHLGGDVLRIELANQVSFLNRAALFQVLDGAERGSHVLLDAQETDYVDPDVLDLIRTFQRKTAPARGVQVSLVGFRSKYQLHDQVQYLDFSTRELQDQLTPHQVLQILKDGQERFRTGRQLTRDLARQARATAGKQHPLAVLLSCIDSRTPAELIFDLGIGDVLSVRIAGNVVTPEVLGSMEYSCAVAGAKLIVVMGHTRCGAVSTAVDLASSAAALDHIRGNHNLGPIVEMIQSSMTPDTSERLSRTQPGARDKLVDDLVAVHVARMTNAVLERSETLNELHAAKKIAIIGGVYDVVTGNVSFLPHDDACVR